MSLHFLGICGLALPWAAPALAAEQFEPRLFLSPMTGSTHVNMTREGRTKANLGGNTLTTTDFAFTHGG
jgi:hypothetical protein